MPNDNQNPFGQGEPKPAARSALHALPPKEIPVTDLCPFIGGVAIPVMPKVMTNPSDIQVGIQLSQCVREKCSMWSTEQEACTIRLGMEAMMSIRGPLLALGNRFGV